MYSYEWDKITRGYKLTTQTGRYVANELRPVFAPELSLTGMEDRLEYDKRETRPLLWAQRNVYIIASEDENGKGIGKKVAQLNNTQYGKPLSAEFFFDGKLNLEPVDISAMIAKNAQIMDIIVADAKRRTKELYDADIGRCDVAYIAFSGGKDSIVLLDICHRVLPLSVPVIFSDTDMELPDTYRIWEEIKNRYPKREFIAARAESSAIENWKSFGPPSRTIKWCCSVHKSTPALMLLKKKMHKSAINAMAFVGVRGDESHSRSIYEDATDGVKNASQLNRMPILDWGAHELWLYIFANGLMINDAYKKGLTRVGCIMCPESSGKYAWFIDKIYPYGAKPYNDVIIETSNKNFNTNIDKTEYIGTLSWQARRSGIVLKETLSSPFEEHNGLTVTFQSSYFTKELFYEWIKTIGMVVKERETGQQCLKRPNTLDNGVPFSYYVPNTGGGKVTFEFRDIIEKRIMMPYLKVLMNKVSACIACRCCEAECSFGAITVNNGKLKIDENICSKCKTCYDICVGNCWRFLSMRYEINKNNIIIGLNSYFNFGLREEWVAVLIEKGEEFFPWHKEHSLGKKMVPAASAWFPQAMLITEKTHKLLPMVNLFKKHGASYGLGWDLIWIALANNAVFMKWFVAATQIDRPYTIEELSDMLSEKYPSINKNARDCGLSALKDMLTKSPLGGLGAVTSLEMKGKTVKSITRKAKDVNQLTILYGLYLIASKTERSSFTVRELMSADEDSTYVSPIVAFGISPDMFKKQCEGLKSKYPDYIETTFTSGLDELTVFTKKYTIDDIITLTLKE
jgi:phosphoadenosine phosphosulfate reductase